MVFVFAKPQPERTGDMKKYFLTTALMGTFIAPAFGDDKIITSANTCTVDVLGVSDNNATANTIATWDLIDYECPAGQYLLKSEDTLECTPCLTGSYCPGGTYTVESENMGKTACPSTHPNSVQGAGADTQCYTACTVATANIAHATAVSGNDYYGSGVDTCGATACETGYHVDGGGLELVEKTPLIPVDYTLAGNDFEYIAQGGTADSNDTAVGLSAQNTWAAEFDYGVIYGKASCQPKADAGNEYIFNNLEALISGSMTMEEIRADLVELVGESRADAYMGYLEVGLAGGEGMNEEEQITAVKKYMAVGIAENANYSTSDTGQYCYCQMDGFTPTGGTREIVTSAPWVSNGSFGSADNCASDCARDCADNLQFDDVIILAFRAAVVGALDLVETGGICAANTINIDWNPDNGGDHIKNMCTYDGTITVPSDPVKPGYTFMGWKLLENTTTE